MFIKGGKASRCVRGGVGSIASTTHKELLHSRRTGAQPIKLFLNNLILKLSERLGRAPDSSGS